MTEKELQELQEEREMIYYPNAKTKLDASSEAQFQVTAAQELKTNWSATKYNGVLVIKNPVTEAWHEIRNADDLHTHFLDVIGVYKSHKTVKDTYSTTYMQTKNSPYGEELAIYTKTKRITFGSNGDPIIEERDANSLRQYVPEIAVEYIPDEEFKTNPKWFVDAVKHAFRNDEETMEAYFQMIGLALYPYREAEVSYWFEGPAGTGKSTIVSVVLESILDKQRDISALTPSQWDENQFMLQGMMGKKVNLTSDDSYKGVFEAGTFKKLVSGESITANIKNRDAVKFKAMALLVSIGNSAPNIKEVSDGPYRRMIKIMMDNKIVGDKNINIKKDIAGNKDGVLNLILNMAIKSITKLIKANYQPVIPARSVVNMMEQKIADQPIRQWFLDFDVEHLKRTGSAVLTPYGMKLTVAYEQYYALWVKNSGYKPKGKHEFLRELRNLLGENLRADIELYNRNNVQYMRYHDLSVKEPVEQTFEDPFEERAYGNIGL